MISNMIEFIVNLANGLASSQFFLDKMKDSRERLASSPALSPAFIACSMKSGERLGSNPT